MIVLELIESEEKMEQTKQIQGTILRKLKEIMDSVEIINVIRGQEDGIPFPILTTLHTDLGYEENEVMGEFYFLPIYMQEQKMHYFSIVMTLDEEVPQNKYEELTLAVNMLNFYMPVGAYTVQKDGGILAYKYTALLPTDTTLESLVTQADACIGTALDLVHKYVDVFMQLLNGKITLQQFELELPNVHQQ